jgi:hypothetical protein
MTRPKNRHEPDPEALERQRRALELKIAGATYREIAAALGYRDGSAAYKAVQAGKRLGFVEPRPPSCDSSSRTGSTACNAPSGLTPVKGDLPAVNAALKISDQRAKLLGLNAPQRTDVTIKLDDQLAAQVIAVLQAVLGDSATRTDPRPAHRRRRDRAPSPSRGRCRHRDRRATGAPGRGA